MQRSAVELSLGRLRRSTGRGLGEEGLPGREGSMCKGAAVGGRRALSELQGCGWVPARLRETADEAVELGWAPVMEAHETERKSSEV